MHLNRAIVLNYAPIYLATIMLKIMSSIHQGLLLRWCYKNDCVCFFVMNFPGTMNVWNQDYGYIHFHFSVIIEGQGKCARVGGSGNETKFNIVSSVERRAVT